MVLGHGRYDTCMNVSLLNVTMPKTFSFLKSSLKEKTCYRTRLNIWKRNDVLFSFVKKMPSLSPMSPDSGTHVYIIRTSMRQINDAIPFLPSRTCRPYMSFAFNQPIPDQPGLHMVHCSQIVGSISFAVSCSLPLEMKSLPPCYKEKGEYMKWTGSGAKKTVQLPYYR